MQISAGLLMYRMTGNGKEMEVFLVHFGGPYWKNKDDGAWTLPKGVAEPGEEAETAAKREFTEETGFIPKDPLISLGEVRHRSGKRVLAWAFRGSYDPLAIRSNTFEIEWPPRSGRRQLFPEVDRAAFYLLPVARRKILSAEIPFLDRLEELVTRA